MVFGSSDHLYCRCCFHVAVRAAFGGPNRTLDLGLSAESLRCSTVKAMAAPIRMTASVALKLPGAMQLIQVLMIVGAANMTLAFSIKNFAPLMAQEPPESILYLSRGSD
jgi:hypothetical protein